MPHFALVGIAKHVLRARDRGNHRPQTDRDERAANERDDAP
jgi:hypothetical protein